MIPRSLYPVSCFLPSNDPSVVLTLSSYVDSLSMALIEVESTCLLFSFILISCLSCSPLAKLSVDDFLGRLLMTLWG